MNPDEHHVALPKLYGAPAYARPPRVFDELERPPDPDDLPLEALRSDDALTGPAYPASPLGPDVGYPEAAIALEERDVPGRIDPQAGGAVPGADGVPGATGVAIATEGPGTDEVPRTEDVPGVPATMDQVAPAPGVTEHDDARPDDPPIPQPRPFGVRALSRFLQRR